MKKKVKKSQKKNHNKSLLQQMIGNKKVLIISFVVLVIIAFCLYKVIVFIQNPTDTFSVEQGQIYQEERATGYIIRDETVVKGDNYKNGMEQIKTEGERVAKGDAIFRYYTTGEEELVKKIQDLDVKISEAMANTNDLLPADVASLESQIEANIYSLYTVNNLQTIQETKKK